MDVFEASSIVRHKHFAINPSFRGVINQETTRGMNFIQRKDSSPHRMIREGGEGPCGLIINISREETLFARVTATFLRASESGGH